MSVLIVVPTFNERTNLPALIASLLQHDGYRVLIVDDHSPDGTGAIADTLSQESSGRVRCLHRDGPRGLGHAYVAGFADAITSDVEIIGQMDADHSHDVADLPAMINAAREHDLVIGSRYVDGGAMPGWSIRRRLLSRFANFYVRAVMGLPQVDCTSGFRCWRRDALAGINLRAVVSRGYAFQVEMLRAAAQRGLRIAEVPISFRARNSGVSKMSAAIMAESMLLPWRFRYQAATARRAGR